MKPTIETLSGVQDIETLTRFREENSTNLADAVLLGNRSEVEAALQVEELLAKKIKALTGTSLDQSIVALVPALGKLKSG